MTALEPRLSLAPGFQPGLGRPQAANRGLGQQTTSASPDQGPDRQLDRDRAAASFRGETACLSPTAIGG